MRRERNRPKLARVLVAVGCVIYLLDISAAQAETYRLIQALGNTEHESARGLSKPECEEKKRELNAIGEALGTSGSIKATPFSKSDVSLPPRKSFSNIGEMRAAFKDGLKLGCPISRARQHIRQSQSLTVCGRKCVYKVDT